MDEYSLGIVCLRFTKDPPRSTIQSFYDPHLVAFPPCLVCRRLVGHLTWPDLRLAQFASAHYRGATELRYQLMIMFGYWTTVVAGHVFVLVEGIYNKNNTTHLVGIVGTTRLVQAIRTARSSSHSPVCLLAILLKQFWNTSYKCIGSSSSAILSHTHARTHLYTATRKNITSNAILVAIPVTLSELNTCRAATTRQPLLSTNYARFKRC